MTDLTRPSRIFLFLSLTLFAFVGVNRWGWGQDSPRLAAIQASSKSNLKILGLAVMQYTQDYDEKLPPLKSPTKAEEVLYPYARTRSIFRHPTTKERYVWNITLSGENIGQYVGDIMADETQSKAAQIPLVFEMRPAPNGKRNVAFLDGHVTELTEAQWRQAKTRWKVRTSVPMSSKPWKLPTFVMPGTSANAKAQKKPATLQEILLYAAQNSDSNTALHNAILRKMVPISEAILGYAEATGKFPPLTDGASLDRTLHVSDNPLDYFDPLSGCFFEPNPRFSGLMQSKAQNFSPDTVLLYDPTPLPDGSHAVVLLNKAEVFIPQDKWEKVRIASGLPATSGTVSSESSLEPRQPVQTDGLLMLLDQATLNARMASSQSGLKQLGLAMLQWNEDNDEKLPDTRDFKKWSSQLKTYLIFDVGIVPHSEPTSIFTDPVSKTAFRANPKIANSSLGSITDSAAAISFFSPRPAGLPLRRNVAFVDGHVKGVFEAVFEAKARNQNIPEALWKLEPAPLVVNQKPDMLSSDQWAAVVGVREQLAKGDVTAALRGAEPVLTAPATISDAKMRSGARLAANLVAHSLAVAMEKAVLRGDDREAIRISERLLKGSDSPFVKDNDGFHFFYAVALSRIGQSARAEQVLKTELRRFAAAQKTADVKQRDFNQLLELSYRQALVMMYLRNKQLAQATEQMRMVRALPILKLFQQSALDMAAEMSSLNRKGALVLSDDERRTFMDPLPITLGMIQEIQLPVAILDLSLAIQTGRTSDIKRLTQELAATGKLVELSTLSTGLASDIPAHNQTRLKNYRQILPVLNSLLDVARHGSATNQQTQSAATKMVDFLKIQPDDAGNGPKMINLLKEQTDDSGSASVLYWETLLLATHR